MADRMNVRSKIYQEGYQSHSPMSSERSGINEMHLHRVHTLYTQTINIVMTAWLMILNSQARLWHYEIKILQKMYTVKMIGRELEKWEISTSFCWFKLIGFSTSFVFLIFTHDHGTRVLKLNCFYRLMIPI